MFFTITEKKKAYIGNLIFMILVWLIPFHVYLVYRALTTWNPYLITYVSFIQLYGTFCTKNTAFIKFGQWFQFKNFFNKSELIFEEAPAEKNCLFAFHPHGIMTYGLNFSMHEKGTIFENNLVGLGSRVALNTPFAGIILKWWGIQPVSSQNLQRLMKSGTNCALLPGGFEEATLSTKSENRVYIKNRKGFIKYALQYGTSIHPTFTFGENQMFNTIDKFINLRLLMNKYKLVGTFFWSRFGSLPEPDLNLITVVGRRINCPIIEKPTTEEIDKYHDIYVKSLIGLYDRHQPKYAPNMKLKIY